MEQGLEPLADRRPWITTSALRSCQRKTGEFLNLNIIDERGAEGKSSTFDPAKHVFDLRLKEGARPRGGRSRRRAAGGYHGGPRGKPVDAGAYRYNAGK